MLIAARDENAADERAFSLEVGPPVRARQVGLRVYMLIAARDENAADEKAFSLSSRATQPHALRSPQAARAQADAQIGFPPPPSLLLRDEPTSMRAHTATSEHCVRSRCEAARADSAALDLATSTPFTCSAR